MGDKKGAKMSERSMRVMLLHSHLGTKKNPSTITLGILSPSLNLKKYQQK
jgi:hypothetical protein